MLRGLVNSYIIELKMKGSSKHTINNYGFHLDKFINFVQDNGLDYVGLTTNQVRLFRNQLVDQGLKAKTINTVLSALKSFYDFLVDEGLVKGNPIITRRLRIKEGQVLPNFMTVEELRILGNWLPKIPGHVSLGFRTMLATGLRVSEVASVTPNDIISLDHGICAIRVRHGKGNKERYAPILDAEVAKDLFRYMGDRRDDLPLFGITHHSFKNWARKCRLETGMNFHTHRCRHTVGTQLLQRGVPIDKVQDVLGHADISTTRHYAKTAPEAILELAAKVDLLKEMKVIYTFPPIGQSNHL